MKKTILLTAILLLVTACNKSNTIADFTSDGCSLFPDKNLITNENWCDCCFDHDIAYWKGGTEDEREKADQKLKECVLEKTDDLNLADLIHKGVKYGGSPYFYNWYRWGYGWDYGRGYKSLSPEENKSAEEKLSTYYDSNQSSVCI